MKNLFITLSFSVIFNLSFSQSPRSIEKAIKILDKNCSDSLKLKICSTETEGLPKLFYPWDGENKTLLEFTSHDKILRYQKYYKKLGINYRLNIQLITLSAYKLHLKGKPIKHDSLINVYKPIDQKWKYEDENRKIVDSIRGVYIPFNLEDCFKQIDLFWNDSTKTKVKNWTEEDFSVKTHHGFGTWIRNNWQLWAGSRLSYFFHEKGVHHPDSMSWIILVSYHRYLNGKEINLEEQINPNTKEK